MLGCMNDVHDPGTSGEASDEDWRRWADECRGLHGRRTSLDGPAGARPAMTLEQENELIDIALRAVEAAEQMAAKVDDLAAAHGEMMAAGGPDNAAAYGEWQRTASAVLADIPREDLRRCSDEMGRIIYPHLLPGAD